MVLLQIGVTITIIVFDNFLTKNDANSRSAKTKVKNRVDQAMELKSHKQQNAQETAPVGLQEGAGGQSFTVLCFPKGMHSCPRVRDNYTAASQ